MTSVKPVDESLTAGSDTSEVMSKYGITRVPADVFHYKEYRYTSLGDAIAQAERDHSADLSRSGSR